MRGRQSERKCVVVFTVELHGDSMGQTRLRHAADASGESLGDSSVTAWSLAARCIRTELPSEARAKSHRTWPSSDTARPRGRRPLSGSSPKRGSGGAGASPRPRRRSPLWPVQWWGGGSLSQYIRSESTASSQNALAVSIGARIIGGPANPVTGLIIEGPSSEQGCSPVLVSGP